jgi:hypothetical protein
MSSVPPGLQENVEILFEGGDAPEWMSFSEVRYYTNAFVTDEHHTKVAMLFVRVPTRH